MRLIFSRYALSRVLCGDSQGLFICRVARATDTAPTHAEEGISSVLMPKEAAALSAFLSHKGVCLVLGCKNRYSDTKKKNRLRKISRK